jgi:cysteinyl-tRNA synthetase
MDDDFNTPQAISAVFDFVNESNKYFENNSNPNKKLCGYALCILIKLGNILTLFQPSLVKSEISDNKTLLEKVKNIILKYKKDVKGESIEELLNLLLIIREEARKKKDWNTADSIRKDLDEIGFEIQDTSNGPIWRKK